MHIPRQYHEQKHRRRKIPERLKVPKYAYNLAQGSFGERRQIPMSVASAMLGITVLIAVPTIGSKVWNNSNAEIKTDFIGYTIDGQRAQLFEENGSFELAQSSEELTSENIAEKNYLEYDTDIEAELAAMENIITPEDMKEQAISEDSITINDNQIDEIKNKTIDSEQPEKSSTEQDISKPNNDKKTSDSDTKSEKDYSYVNASTFADISQDERIELMGEMAREDDRLTGVPASLTVAQAILESGFMESSLTTEHENYFGIKASTDGYNWKDSTWNGDVADMLTGEEYDGWYTTISAGFRCYDNAWDSVKDHSAYLLNNTKNNGESRRYPDIEKCEHADEAAWILVDGGYATDSSYAESLLELVDKYDLTKFDYIETEEKAEEKSNENKAENNSKKNQKAANKENDSSESNDISKRSE